MFVSIKCLHRLMSNLVILISGYPKAVVIGTYVAWIVSMPCPASIVCKIIPIPHAAAQDTNGVCVIERICAARVGFIPVGAPFPCIPSHVLTAVWTYIVQIAANRRSLITLVSAARCIMVIQIIAILCIPYGSPWVYIGMVSCQIPSRCLFLLGEINNPHFGFGNDLKRTGLSLP